MKLCPQAALVLSSLAILAWPNAASAAELRRVANGDAAKLAYLVAQTSPLLPKSAKTAISQDFNGAPLAGKARIRRVTAAAVACRVRTEAVDKTPTRGARCTIDYGRKRTVTLKEPESWDLYEALGTAGVEDDAGMSHLARAVAKLDCTINDKLAQQTPATGDKVSGFDCRFRTDQ